MGNQYDRERLRSVTTLSENSCWETIANTPSFSACRLRKMSYDGDNGKLTHVATPFSKQFRGGNNGNKNNVRRWSHSRKVNNNVKKQVPAVSSKRLMILKEADEQAEAAKQSCIEQKNSTICNGGVSLCGPNINGLSPIKNDGIKSKGVTVVPLKSYLVEHLSSTSKTCSLTKVEKWLASTEKHVKNREFTDPVSPVDFCVNKNVEDTKYVTMEETSISAESSNQTLSPIQSECVIYEEENTLESDIISEMVTVKTKSKAVKSIIVQQGNKATDPARPKRKKRKRIAMKKIPAKKKPGVNRGKMKLNNRVTGKNLPVPKVSIQKPDATLKDGSLCFVEKRYNLRSKINCLTNDIALEKDTEVLLKKDTNVAPDETPPDESMMRSSRGKRKLLFTRKKLQVDQELALEADTGHVSTSSGDMSHPVDVTCCLQGSMPNAGQCKMNYNMRIGPPGQEIENESCVSDCLCPSI